MNHLLQFRNYSNAFSLVELLVIVSIVGILVAIALPNITSMNSAATTASNQRNAQTLVSMYVSGECAGVIWGGATRNTKIASVVAGATPSSGLFAGKTFKVPNLSSSDMTSAYPFIGFDAGGDLFYDKAGAQSSS